MRRRALDMFCGTGGAAMGLFRAGFLVHGIDLKPQPRYPFQFTQGDALEADLSGYDFVWASPPCQAHCRLRTMPNAKQHEDLIPATRAKLRAWGGPYIIENVPGAPLINPVMLCGTMFGLQCEEAELRRHRLFESNVPLLTPICQHGQKPRVIGVYGNGGGASQPGKRPGRKVWDMPENVFKKKREEAMGIDWMRNEELSQAIPPAYSEFLGKQVLLAVDTGRARLTRDLR